MHTDPADAVQIHQDVLAKKSVGIHWGTFRLGNEVITKLCQALSLFSFPL